jgi:hypothetical protein
MFQAWYLSIRAQLSIPLWQALYDGTTNNIVSTLPIQHYMVSSM